MKKRIVFEFDENSITELGECDVEAVISLKDGRVIVLPKLHGAIECAPTMRAADVCPADGGKHSWHPNKDNYLIYSCRKCGARG